MRIRGEVAIGVPPARTWDALADLGSHVDWMADAETITFTSDQQSGVGTTFDCVTKVGPFRTVDKMVVTDWADGQRIAVRHTGIVVGTGVFEVATEGPATSRLIWTEDLRFPWFLGGVVTTFVARPILKRIWMGNLCRFRAILEQPHLS
jgi:hypothetical protein